MKRIQNYLNKKQAEYSGEKEHLPKIAVF